MIIDKVITIWLDSDAMEKINKITGIDAFATDNWVDYSIFGMHPILKQYVTHEKFIALKNGKADYIAFRIDY